MEALSLLIMNKRLTPSFQIHLQESLFRPLLQDLTAAWMGAVLYLVQVCVGSAFL